MDRLTRTSASQCSAPSARATIVILDGNKVFFPGDVVKGSVIVYASTTTSIFDAHSLKLVGTTRVYSGRLDPSAVIDYNFHRFLDIEHPVQGSGEQTHRVTLEPGAVHRIPFSFNLPWSLPSGQCQDCMSTVQGPSHTVLPASVNEQPGSDCKIDALGAPSAQTYYSIVFRTVEVMSDKYHDVSASKRFRLMPFSDPVQLPSYGSEEGGLQLGPPSILRSAIGRRLCDITTGVWSPLPMVLRGPSFAGEHATPVFSHVVIICRPLGDLTASSYISLSSQSSGQKSAPVNLPEIKSIEASLDVLTTFSSWHMSTPATEEPASDEPPRQVFTKRLGLGSRKTHFPCQWKPYDCEGGQTRYCAELAIPIGLPSPAVLAPSFQSCFLARTYRLNVKLLLSVPGQLKPKALRLRAPVLVVAAASE